MIVQKIKTHFYEKNHFPFSGLVKKNDLDHIAKKGPKNSTLAEIVIVFTVQTPKEIFSQKNTFSFSVPVKRFKFWSMMLLFAHFWQCGPDAIIFLARKRHEF